MLVVMKKIKEGVKIVKEFGLKPSLFPKLVELASLNTASYFSSQTFKAKTDQSYMPLHKVEDLFSGDLTMISCLVTRLG